MSKQLLHDASKAFLVSLLLSLLAGCVTPRTPMPAARSPQDLQNWQASGRIAVSGANEGGSGSFTWTQRGGNAVIRMRGPVGVGSLELTLPDNGELRVRSGEGEWVAEDAANELAARLGAPIPTSDLRYWMLGVAAPGEHEWTQGTEQATLKQHDWRIDYQRFDVTQGVRLPMKLLAVSGVAKVRIVIDRWRLE